MERSCPSAFQGCLELGDTTSSASPCALGGADGNYYIAAQDGWVAHAQTPRSARHVSARQLVFVFRRHALTSGTLIESTCLMLRCSLRKCRIRRRWLLPASGARDVRGGR